MNLEVPTRLAREDATKALQRAREDYAARDLTLPTDPEILHIAAKYSTGVNPYEVGSAEATSYDAAWWDTVFTDAMVRIAAAALQPLLDRVADAEREHVCDESCTVAAAAECATHGILGMADDERSARQMMLEHLRSYHPRRAHHAIAKMQEELDQ